jgi:hypothetical protein
MTLDAAFKELSARWERLAEELEHGLLWSVTETKPAEEHMLATHYVDGATDLVSAAREGLAACRAAVDAGPSLGLAGQALLRCQERYNVVTELFNSRLASYGRLRRLRRFGREKRGAWRGWAAHVRKALDRCHRPMDDLRWALFSCWQEVTDRVGTVSVAVQATNIGQQITTAARAAGAAASP